MNNLESLNFTDLSVGEMRNIDGGFVCLGACIVAIAAGAAFVAGLGVGVALYSATN